MAVATPPPVAAASEPVLRRGPPASRRHAIFALLAMLGAGIGVSPFFFAYYDSRVWVPIGLGLLAVLTAGLIVRPPRVGAPAVMALVGLSSLAIWALASSLWADSVEQAVVDGNRLLVYGVVLGLVMVLVRSDAAAMWLLGGLTVTALAVGGVVLGRMLAGDDTLFLNGRLHSPLGYINGEAAFFLVALWPCVAAAEQRRSAVLSGVGLAGASVLGSLLVLSGSRGVMLGAAVSGLLLLALVPGRLRRVWVLIFAGASVTLAAPVVLDVASAGAAADVPDGVQRSAAAAALASAAAVGVLWWVGNAGLARWDAARRWLRPAATGVLAVTLMAALVVGVLSRDGIARSIDRQYDAFVSLSAKPTSGSSAVSRLTSGGGNRYDYWRIAWQGWKDRPVAGVGAGNYDGPYFAQRATTEDVRQPHSLPLQTLSELGVIGGLLLAIFLIGVGWGTWRTARAARHSPGARFVAVASAGAVIAWLVHTSVDWIHLLPGVTAAALAGAALLVRKRDAMAPADTATVRQLRCRAAAAVVIAAALALTAVSLTRQGMAEYFRAEARAALAAKPAETLVQADRSLRLDPEAVAAYQLKAAALARFNEASAARRALIEATRREPGDFVTWALLGDLSVRTGNLPQARIAYGRAHALNPRDPTLASLSEDPRRTASGVVGP
jgi:O-antigen ligase